MQQLPFLLAFVVGVGLFGALVFTLVRESYERDLHHGAVPLGPHASTLEAGEAAAPDAPADVEAAPESTAHLTG